MVRNELSPAELARTTGRLKVLYELVHPETQHGAAGVGREKSRQVGDSNSPAERFTAETAKATGISERTIQRNAERGERITSDALELIKGTDLDTGTYLDKLKAVPKEEQAKTVREQLREMREGQKAPSAPRQCRAAPLTCYSEGRVPSIS